MPLLAALAAHAAVVGGFVLAVPDSGVAPAAWTVVYLVGALALVASGAVPPRRQPSVARSLEWLVHCIVLALLFFGADRALSLLGNAVKPRQGLPDFLGGLELWFGLVPGMAAVAVGLAVYRLASRSSHRTDAAAHAEGHP